MKKCLSIFAVFLIPLVAFSQSETDSRKELWLQQREEKVKNIVPEKTSTAENIFLRIEKGGIKLNYKGFYPKFANLSTGSGFAPGVRYWNPNFLGSKLDLQATGAYSTRSYQQYTFQFGRILQQGPEPLIGESGSGGLSQFRGLTKRRRDFFLYADVRYRNYPQEDFFGIGPDSLRANRSDYLLEDTSFDGIIGYRLNPWSVIAVRSGYLDINVDSGEDDRFPNTDVLFDDEEAPGLDQQPDYFRTSGTFFVDTREKPGNPHHGGLYGLEYASYNDRGGDEFQFRRLTIDARHFLSLWSVQRVLALRFLSSMDFFDDGSRVPFFLMETLGGDILRGFREFRFRDTNRLLLSAEYRWEAAPAWELALFLDAGKVFADREDFDFENLEEAYGFGIRFKLPEKMFMRFDIARSDEGTRFLWKFASSF